MSHFTSVKTKIRDLLCLERALKDLGYEFSKAENEQLRAALEEAKRKGPIYARSKLLGVYNIIFVNDSSIIDVVKHSSILYKNYTCLVQKS